MKHISLHSRIHLFFLAILLWLPVVYTQAVVFCNTTITATDGATTVDVSCTNPSANTYVVTITSANANFSGLIGAGNYCHVNNAGTNLQVLQTSDFVSWNSSTRTLTITLTSTGGYSPVFYTPLYLNINGEKVFNALQNQAIDYTGCSDCKIYFVNTPNWGTPYAYLWDGGNNNGWPGVAMSNTGITTTNSNYSVWSTDCGSYVNAVFSNNGANQSGDQENFTADRYFNYADNKWYSSENTLHINAGGWQEAAFNWTNQTKTTVTATITLAASTTYEFYIHGSDYFKNNGTMTSANCTGWKMNEANNCHITTQYAGIYTFNYDFATNYLSVVYPNPQPVTVPVNSEAYADCQVASVLGTTKYTPSGVTGYEAWGGGSGSEESISGKNTVHITGSNYLAVRHADKDVSDYTHLHVDIWMAEANNIGLKLLCYDGGFKDGTTYNITTTAAGWKSLDIPLSSFNQGTYLQKAVGVYPVDLAGKDIWLANIYYYTTSATCDSEPEDAPEDALLTDCQVYSLFSDYHYTGQTARMNNALWCGGNADEVVIDGKRIKKLYGSSGCYGFEKSDWTTNGTMDVSGYNYMHIDVWVPVRTTVRFFPINRNAANNGNDAEKYVERTVTAGSWQSIDIPLSEFTSQGLALNRVYQFKFEGLSGKKLWFTNLYFYKTASCEPDWLVWNLALNRPSVAEYNSANAYQSNDGSNTTRWGSNGATHQTQDWWYVDLGAVFNLTHIDILWEGAYSDNFILQVANELPANVANDALWTTASTITGSQNVGQTEANLNVYNLTNTVGRYVRIKSLHNATGYGISFWELRVYGSSYVGADANPPTMVSAEFVSNNAGNTGVIVELHADDIEDGDDGVTKFRIVEMSGGVEGIATIVNVDGSNHAALAPLSTGSHSYHVYAVDAAGNVSANYEDLSFCFVNPADNLALNKTVVAGYTPGNVAEVPTAANDGVLTSFWTTYNDRPISEHWWSVDLGQVYQLSRVEVSWLTGTQSNHYLIQVAHVAPGDRSDDLLWYTVREINETQVSGASGADDKNSYTINTSARYVRIKMLSRNASYIAMKEFRVFGSSCADLDNTAPVISTASVVSTDATTGEAVIQLTATDIVTSPVNTYIVNNTTTSERAEYVANASGQITLTGLESCRSYSLQIQAKDEAANLSTVTNLSVTVAPSTSLNIASIATASAGHTENDATATIAYAIDGDNNTQWNSNPATAGTNEWYKLDLGRMFDLNQVRILWGLDGALTNGDYPVDYRLQISSDDTNWATFAHYTKKTETGQWLDTVYTDPLPARYMRIWVDRHDAYSMGIKELEIYSKNACYVSDNKPVITLAEVSNVNPTSVDVHCEAWAEGKTHNQLRYYYKLYKDGVKVDEGTKTHTSGNFAFTGLTKGASYRAEIWTEIISNSVRSDNYKTINFSVTYSSLHYLTEETECNWTDGINKSAWQFKYTDNFSPTEVDGNGDPLQILSYIDHTIIRDVNTTPPTIQYKLYEDGYGSPWTSGTNLFFRNPKDKHLIMYALGTDKFVCNLDELYVSGEAVGGWWTDTYAPNASQAADYRMTYDNETGLFKWTGTVTPGADKHFKIVIRDIRAVAASSDTWAFDRIMDTNKDYDRDWTRATLYFDMKTWTWWWENAMESCTREGGPGVINKDNDGTAFTHGYKFDTYVQTVGGVDYLVVEAEAYDPTITNAAALHIYKNQTADVTEVTAPAVKTYTVGGNTYTYYRFTKRLSEIPEAINGIIRYKVKFEGAAGIIRNTLYHYFDIQNKVCAPDSYDIYDHNGELNDADYETPNPDDAAYELYNYKLNPAHVIGDDNPAIVPGTVREAGGVVVQPVYYRRKFDPGKWYSIILPFDVDSVVVIDGGKPYKIYPKTKTANGYYWLRYYDNATAQDENGFQAHWQDMAVDAGLTAADMVPKKNVPYIISFPKSGNYYHDKYVEFRSKGYQDFAAKSSFTQPSGVTTTGTFEYYGNTTLFKQSMGKSYYFNDWYSSYDAQGYPEQQYFVQESEHLVLWPFECFVISDAETMTRVRIIGRVHNTPTTIEETLQDDAVQEKITVYSITGQLVARYSNMSLNEVLEQSENVLQPGCYILRYAADAMKILVGGK